MNNYETIVFFVSFLTLIISLFAIWLAIMFYKYCSQLSSLVNEMSRGLDIATTRLEAISTLLYGENASITDKRKEKLKTGTNLLKIGEEAK